MGRGEVEGKGMKGGRERKRRREQRGGGGEEVEEHLGRGVLLTPLPLGLAQPWVQAGKAPAPLS